MTRKPKTLTEMQGIKRKQKYKQPGTAVLLRIPDAWLEQLRAEAYERRWSVQSLIAWCIEQQIGLPRDDIRRR